MDNDGCDVRDRVRKGVVGEAGIDGLGVVTDEGGYCDYDGLNPHRLSCDTGQGGGRCHIDGGARNCWV